MKLPAPLAFIARRLPEAPPSFALATALNLARPKFWPEEDFAWLTGKTVRLLVSDLDRGVNLTFDGQRFRSASLPADVTFGASLEDYLILARRQEDPDTLFFQRRLTIEGDTEIGLALKNLLDSTDLAPLFALLPRPLAARFGL
ncbi:Predicted lipid carrier protein YhbT, contains SCP2 domain [Formivibrio citricus]|uniref:Ubiquinone biosynthesis accessory factor UbiT n=1 Tax=Formivibrio citricus TaxID=83765 RepID=A0A1I5C334_9NEIS|nr:SCP2 sterol-binding domain-containing protein [Formivibrio citricus]SFN81433.1 Predicted lipid carrier protein YhbT, contains SCP2 domain [Formivibrio citricus]